MRINNFFKKEAPKFIFVKLILCTVWDSSRINHLNPYQHKRIYLCELRIKSNKCDTDEQIVCHWCRNAADFCMFILPLTTFLNCFIIPNRYLMDSFRFSVCEIMLLASIDNLTCFPSYLITYFLFSFQIVLGLPLLFEQKWGKVGQYVVFLLTLKENLLTFHHQI